MSWHGFKYTGGNLPFPPVDSAIVIIDETSRFHLGSNPGRSLTLASISSGLHRLGSNIIVWVWAKAVGPNIPVTQTLNTLRSWMVQFIQQSVERWKDTYFGIKLVTYVWFAIFLPFWRRMWKESQLVSEVRAVESNMISHRTYGSVIPALILSFQQMPIYRTSTKIRGIQYGSFMKYNGFQSKLEYLVTNVFSTEVETFDTKDIFEVAGTPIFSKKQNKRECPRYGVCSKTFLEAYTIMCTHDFAVTGCTGGCRSDNLGATSDYKVGPW